MDLSTSPTMIRATRERVGVRLGAKAWPINVTSARALVRLQGKGAMAAVELSA